MIFRLSPAFNRNPATVAFDKLLGDEQSNAGPHSAPGREEGIEHSWQNIARNADAVILYA